MVFGTVSVACTFTVEPAVNGVGSGTSTALPSGVLLESSNWNRTTVLTVKSAPPIFWMTAVKLCAPGGTGGFVLVPPT